MIPLSLPPDASPDLRNDKRMTLIFVRNRVPVQWARTRAEKDELVAEYQAISRECKVLLAWTGAYHTDVFQLTPSDISRLYCFPL